MLINLSALNEQVDLLSPPSPPPLLSISALTHLRKLVRQNGTNFKFSPNKKKEEENIAERR